jgi:hypothetical protein
MFVAIVENLTVETNRAVAARFRVKSGHVGFVVYKVVLGRFPPITYVSSANHHSTKFFILIITRGMYNRPVGGRRAEWTQLVFTLHYSNIKNIKE